MRYKLLGRSGLRVSELSLGTMTFGDDWGWGATKEESRKIFDAYVEAGGNFIDSAINYTDGTSEKFIGEFINTDRDHFVVATKYTLSSRPDDPNAGGNHRKNLTRSLDISLKRLQTDYIDLFWLHMWDFTTPLDEIMRALDDAVRAGKVLHIGISDTPAWIAARATTIAELRGWASFTALQVPYNLLRREVERELLPMAKALDLGITPWAPISAGKLTGKYSHTESDEPKRFESGDMNEREIAIVDKVLQIAQAIGHSPAQVAINWVRQQTHRGVIVPIVGARTERQIRDNLGCLEFTLSDEHMAELNAISKIQLGFPHEFLASEHVQGLIHGEAGARLDRSRG